MPWFISFRYYINCKHQHFTIRFAEGAKQSNRFVKSWDSSIRDFSFSLPIVCSQSYVNQNRVGYVDTVPTYASGWMSDTFYLTYLSTH